MIKSFLHAYHAYYVCAPECDGKLRQNVTNIVPLKEARNHDKNQKFDKIKSTLPWSEQCARMPLETTSNAVQIHAKPQFRATIKYLHFSHSCLQDAFQIII